MVHHNPDDILEKKIDQLLTFYRARLHLKDSKFKILTDIAEDAEAMVSFLEIRKGTLIRDLKRRNIHLEPDRINGFVLYQARYSEMGIG